MSGPASFNPRPFGSAAAPEIYQWRIERLLCIYMRSKRRLALWSRIEVKGMPDTSKHGQPYRIPRRRESVRPAKPDASALAKLLDEWMRDDKREQQETFEVLRRSLDEDRPDGYKLFS